MVMYTSLSDIGLVRNENQDDLAVVEHEGALLAVVCDGIGGSNGGSVASKMVTDLLCKSFLSQSRFNDLSEIRYWFTSTISKINEKTFRASLENIKYHGMGTTLICVVLFKGKAVGFNIGDSRLYSIKDHKMTCLSHDQTYVYEMYLRDEITFEETATHPKRNILMNAVGIDSKIEFETIFINEPWDHFLLCSDGLHGYVADPLIETVFANGSLVSRRDALLKHALEAGGYDNISMILIEGDKE